MKTKMFESAKNFLDSIIRNRFAFRILVEEPEFEWILFVKTEGKLTTQNDAFTNEIKSDVFIANVKSFHVILQSVCKCLRTFANDKNNMGDFGPLINKFHCDLAALPVCELLKSAGKTKELQNFYNHQKRIDV